MLKAAASPNRYAKAFTSLMLLATICACSKTHPLYPPQIEGTTADSAGKPTTSSGGPQTTRNSLFAKSGQDCQTSLLGIFPLGDPPSLQQALEHAHIPPTVPTEEDLSITESFWFYGVVSRTCINVTTG